MCNPFDSDSDTDPDGLSGFSKVNMRNAKFRPTAPQFWYIYKANRFRELQGKRLTSEVFGLVCMAASFPVCRGPIKFQVLFQNITK